VFFERGLPAEICYGDGELDMQHSEDWTEAPGLLAPDEVEQLFSDEEGEQGDRAAASDARRERTGRPFA
jgi:hypothetical protein